MAAYRSRLLRIIVQSSRTVISTTASISFSSTLYAPFIRIVCVFSEIGSTRTCSDTAAMSNLPAYFSINHAECTFMLVHRCSVNDMRRSYSPFPVSIATNQSSQQSRSKLNCLIMKYLLHHIHSWQDIDHWTIECSFSVSLYQMAHSSREVRHAAHPHQYCWLQ